MNKLLIEILQKIPEKCTPTIHKTSTEGVIHYDNGDTVYPGEMGWRLHWSLDNKLMSIILWVFEEDVFYQVDDYANAKRTTQTPFNLGEFVKLFEV